MPPWVKTGPLSVESRLNHIYPQMEAKGIVPFIWHVQSQYPFYVTSGSKVQIRSSITETIY